MPEETFNLDAVNLIPTDELIDELLNRFPTVVVGYVDENDEIHVNWDGPYCCARGLSQILTETLRENCECEYE